MGNRSYSSHGSLVCWPPDLAKDGESLGFGRPALKSLALRLAAARAALLRLPAIAASWGKKARPWFLFVIYNSLLALLFPIVAVAFLWHVLLRGHARVGLLERLGMVPPSLPEDNSTLGPGIWLHAVSVGEVVAALPVVKRIYQSTSLPLLASVTTPTGRQVGESRLRDLVSAFFYFPFDFPLPVRSLLDAVSPACLVLMESEIWPNLIFLARARGTRIVLANGRISDRSFRLARLFRPLYKWALNNLHLLCMQSEADQRRAIALGASPEQTLVAGNVKFDELDASLQPPFSRADFGLGPQDLVMLAGSTHQGEDECLLDAYWQVRVYNPEARLMIAPRHLQRVGEVEELILARGFSSVRRSQLSAHLAAAHPDTTPVILVDTMGELASLYSLCSFAFVGGSLVRKGGQNILQPLAQGKPVFFGPHMENFREIARQAAEAGVGFQVKNAFELAGKISSLWKDHSLMEELSRKARDFISLNKGASATCAQAILDLTRKEPGT